ncbi:MAG: hypothetical protein OEW49_04050 [Nitrosopumilus sp.]|nr:hypothetical protein [Nitrosopumilus sp.]
MKKLVLISIVVVITVATLMAITVVSRQDLYKNDDEILNQKNELTKMQYFDKCTSTIPLNSKIIQKSDSITGKFERLVFFLEPDSIGYVCARYSSDLDNTGIFKIPNVIHKNIFETTSSEVPEFVLNIEPNPISLDNGSYDVIYILHPLENIKPGIYWISFSQLCDALPIAVGLEDGIDGSLMPILERRHSCPAKYFDVDIIGFGEMNMKYEVANVKS